MASNPVVNTLTFSGSVAGQASISAQGIAGNLTFLLPNIPPTVNQLLTATAINGNSVFLGWSSAQSLSNIPLSALSPTGATNGDVIQLVGGAWTFSAFVPGAGTVTSVALSVPAELSIAGSPITTAGTLALSWASGTGSGGQGKVIATPSGGGAGAYAGRVLVAGDIPALAYDAAGAAATAQSNAEAFATSADTTVLAAAEAYVQTFNPVAHQFLNSYTSSTGVFTAAQPDFTDLTGAATIAQINSKRGNGGFVQLAASGTAGTAGDVVTFDANGNTVDSTVLLSSLAPLASPTFTGTVTTGVAQLAGTGTRGIFVNLAPGPVDGVLIWSNAGNSTVSVSDSTGINVQAGSGAVNVQASTTVTLNAPQNEAVLTNAPANGDNSSAIATTSYVQAQGYLTSASAASTYAPLASPTFTGTVTLPTVQLASFGSAPASSTTAGTAGEFVYFNGVLYFCSVTGGVGAATWNTVNITAAP